jgi:hypothetical protein
MLLVETRKGGLPKMIQHYHRKWQLQALGATAAKVASTQPTCITNSRSYRYHGNRHVLSVRVFGALYSKRITNRSL